MLALVLEPLSCEAIQAWNRAGVTTWIVERIRLWPDAAEQVADDRVAAEAVGVTRQCVVMPGTASS